MKKSTYCYNVAGQQASSPRLRGCSVIEQGADQWQHLVPDLIDSVSNEADQPSST